jgi:hypothetical protein
MPQGPPTHQRQQNRSYIAESADDASDADGNGLPDIAWQPPPDCCPDDNRAAEQEQSNAVSPQGWVDVLHSRSDSSHPIAQTVRKTDQHRRDTE